jgi:hypothetical protein
MDITNSILLYKITKDKLLQLIDKFKNKKITIEQMENCQDRDELIYCYYMYKREQKKEVNDLCDILKNLSF